MLANDTHPLPAGSYLWKGMEGDGNGEGDRGPSKATSAVTGQRQASLGGQISRQGPGCLPEEVTMAWGLGWKMDGSRGWRAFPGERGLQVPWGRGWQRLDAWGDSSPSAWQQVASGGTRGGH